MENIFFWKFSGFSFFHFSLFWQGSTQWMMPAVFPLPSRFFIFLIFFFFLMIDINDDLIVFFFLVPRRPKLLMLSHPSIAWSISIFFVIYVELKRWCLFGFLTHGRLHRFLLPFGPLWGQISGEDFDWALHASRVHYLPLALRQRAHADLLRSATSPLLPFSRHLGR